MLRLLLSIFTGLVGAAVLHLVILFSIPHFSNRDAYTRAVAQGVQNRFHMVEPKIDRPGQNKAELISEDPFMRVAVCTFDIEEKPVRLSAFGAVPFWSIAVFDSTSNEIFSMNDRTSAGGELDIVIANAEQSGAIRKTQVQALSKSILVEAGHEKGYVVLRTMVPQASFLEEAERFVGAATCEPTAIR